MFQLDFNNSWHSLVFDLYQCLNPGPGFLWILHLYLKIFLPVLLVCSVLTLLKIEMPFSTQWLTTAADWLSLHPVDRTFRLKDLFFSPSLWRQTVRCTACIICRLLNQKINFISEPYRSYCSHKGHQSKAFACDVLCNECCECGVLLCDTLPVLWCDWLIDWLSSV